MSASHNQSHQTKPVSETYIKEVLNKKEKCPKHKCKGTLVDVLVRYENQGPINQEKECCECGRIVRNNRFQKERTRRYNNFLKNRDRNENRPYKSRVL